MTRLDVVPAPRGMKWRPGQHCFLRFTGLEILGNHPFTIASAFINDGRAAGKEGDTQSLTFYVRSHAGLTRKLAAYGRLTPEATSRAWVEGPYGGIPYAVENVFNCMILVSGGGGVTACLPRLEHLVHKRANGQDMRTRAVKFMWVVRYVEHLSWIEESLRAL